MCPKCRAPIPSGQLNVAADLAVCPACNEAFTISSQISGGPSAVDFDIRQAPAGAWFEDTGTGWRIGGSTRSAVAFFLVPFMCVWSGGSLGGIYGMQIVHGEFNLWLSLFGIPFVLGTLALGSMAVMSVVGKVEVSVEHDEGRVFSGVGPFGRTQRFDWSSISAVEEGLPLVRNRGSGNSGGMGPAISLVGQSRTSFGSMLNEARRYYVLQGLRTLLAERNR
jgi:hypothetical protein